MADSCPWDAEVCPRAYPDSLTKSILNQRRRKHLSPEYVFKVGWAGRTPSFALVPSPKGLRFRRLILMELFGWGFEVGGEDGLE